MSLMEKAIVSEAAASKIVARIIDDDFSEKIISLGFEIVSDESSKIFSIEVPDQADKIQILASLRDEGVCFSGGREWSPAEVFEYFRDQGYLSGNYRKIIWESPDKPIILENN